MLVVSRVIFFASTCPHCKRDQVQDRFTATDLMRLQYGGFPIEAYCQSCDEFWPVSIRKRVELGDVVAATCGLPPFLDVGQHAHARMVLTPRQGVHAVREGTDACTRSSHASHHSRSAPGGNRSRRCCCADLGQAWLRSWRRSFLSATFHLLV